MDYNNLSSPTLLEKEFYIAEKNKNIKQMAQLFHRLYELGFGGTNWRNEFDFYNLGA